MGLARVVRDHFAGISDPANGAGARPYLFTRVLVYGLPVAVGTAAFVLSWDVRPLSSSLVAAYTLAAGVLIAAFAQIASWRSRLEDRAKDRPRSESPARRALNRAAAHTLVGVLASLLATVLTLFLTLPGEHRLLSAASAAAGVYVLALFLLIVDALYVGYESSRDSGVVETDADLESDIEADLPV